MKHKISNQSGFTLVELLLAMSIFTVVMIITTTGFIAMNRSFTRGTVRKQLSEGVQRTTEDVTRIVRALPQKSGKALFCKAGTTTAGCVVTSDWNILCLTGARYFWAAETETNPKPNGLYKDTQECSAPALNPANSQSERLVDERYKVVKFEVNTYGSSEVHLFTVSGIFRTADNDAFDLMVPVDELKCRGSALSSAVRTCAIERFNFTINARGDTQ